MARFGFAVSSPAPPSRKRSSWLVPSRGAWAVYLQVVAFALAIVPQAVAQEANLEMGYKPYNAFHSGDIDTVNTISGNLSVRIPLVSYPQRGDLRLNFGIAYDHTGFAATYECFIDTCKTIWFQGPDGPFSYDDQGFVANRQQLLCPLPPCSRGNS